MENLQFFVDAISRRLKEDWSSDAGRSFQGQGTWHPAEPRWTNLTTTILSLTRANDLNHVSTIKSDQLVQCQDQRWWVMRRVHHQVKFTIPGPMTISDGVKNKHYEDVEHLHRHLSTFHINYFGSLTIPWLRAVMWNMSVMMHAKSFEHCYGLINLKIMILMATTMKMIKSRSKMTTETMVLNIWHLWYGWWRQWWRWQRSSRIQRWRWWLLW